MRARHAKNVVKKIGVFESSLLCQQEHSLHPLLATPLPKKKKEKDSCSKMARASSLKNSLSSDPASSTCEFQTLILLPLSNEHPFPLKLAEETRSSPSNLRARLLTLSLLLFLSPAAEVVDALGNHVRKH